MQKVIITRIITLKLRQIAYIAVYYVNLPKDHTFIFTSSYPATINAMLNSKVPKIIVLHNLSSKSIKINK